MAQEGQEPTARDDRGDASANELIPSRAGRPRGAPGSSIEQALRRFQAAASAYVGDGGELSATRDAIHALAAAGRAAAARPEELVVMLKHRCSALLSAERRNAVDGEVLKEQFVTWLIEAYFDARAD